MSLVAAHCWSEREADRRSASVPSCESTHSSAQLMVRCGKCLLPRFDTIIWCGCRFPRALKSFRTHSLDKFSMKMVSSRLQHTFMGPKYTVSGPEHAQTKRICWLILLRTLVSCGSAAHPLKLVPSLTVINKCLYLHVDLMYGTRVYTHLRAELLHMNGYQGVNLLCSSFAGSASAPSRPE
jgi:hypothetical protein